MANPQPAPAPAEEKKPRAPVPATPRPARGAQIHFGRVKEAVGARNHYFIEIPTGIDIATVLEPGYWAPCVSKFRPMDLLELFCEDGTWEALARIMFVGRAEVRLSTIYVVEHEKADAADLVSDLHEVVYKGPGVKYCVVRRDTGAVIKDHLWPQSEAVAFLRDHLRKVKD